MTARIFPRAAHQSTAIAHMHESLYIQSITIAHMHEYPYGYRVGPSHWGLIAPEHAACGSGQTQSPVNFARPGGVDVSRISASTPLWRKNDITRYDVVSRVGEWVRKYHRSSIFMLCHI